MNTNERVEDEIIISIPISNPGKEWINWERLERDIVLDDVAEASLRACMGYELPHEVLLTHDNVCNRLTDDWKVRELVRDGWDPVMAYMASCDLSTDQVIMSRHGILTTQRCVDSIRSGVLSVVNGTFEAHSIGLFKAARDGLELAHVPLEDLSVVSGISYLKVCMARAERDGIFPEMMEQIQLHYGSDLASKVLNHFQGENANSRDIPDWAPPFKTDWWWIYEGQVPEPDEWWAIEWNSPTQTGWLDQEVHDKRARSVSRAIRRERRN